MIMSAWKDSKPTHPLSTDDSSKQTKLKGKHQGNDIKIECSDSIKKYNLGEICFTPGVSFCTKHEPFLCMYVCLEKTHKYYIPNKQFKKGKTVHGYNLSKIKGKSKFI